MSTGAVHMAGAGTYSPHTMMTDVLTKLLTVVVADPVPEIRLATLREFNIKFYDKLALSDNIQVSAYLLRIHIIARFH